MKEPKVMCEIKDLAKANEVIGNYVAYASYMQQDNRYWYGQAHRNYEEVKQGHRFSAVLDFYAELCARYYDKELTFEILEDLISELYPSNGI